MEGLPIDTIIKGDSLEVLRGLPDGFAQLVLTSPPYWGLRDYRAGGESLAGQWGREPTPEAHVERLAIEWGREVRRVLRDDGIMVINYGESYASSSTYNAQRTMHTEAGWKQAGKGPNCGMPPGLKPKDLVGMPWRIAQALQADGWWWRAWWPWVKLNGMPESTRDRPALSCEVMLMFSKRARYYWDQEAVRVGYAAQSIERLLQPGFDAQKGGPKDGGAGHSARKALNNQREKLIRSEKWKTRYEGWDEIKDSGLGRIRKTGDWYRESVALAAAQARAWADHAEAHLAGEAPMLLGMDGFPLGQLHPTYAYPGSHFATYPPELVRPIIRAATSERGQCPACGAPWVREVERGLVPTKKAAKTFVIDERDLKADGNHQAANRQKDGHKSGYISANTTTGWSPSCGCEPAELVPQIVLDPFAGTGTTCVVAAEEGRNSIGIDLYGGDHDFGGHTAMDRLRAASGEGAPLEHVRAERDEGQLSLLE